MHLECQAKPSGNGTVPSRFQQLTCYQITAMFPAFQNFLRAARASFAKANFSPRKIFFALMLEKTGDLALWPSLNVSKNFGSSCKSKLQPNTPMDASDVQSLAVEAEQPLVAGGYNIGLTSSILRVPPALRPAVVFFHVTKKLHHMFVCSPAHLT